MATLPTATYHVMELLARAANQEKETKGTQIGKEEIQPSLITVSLLCTQNSKEIYRKSTRIIQLVKMQDTQSTYRQ